MTKNTNNPTSNMTDIMSLPPVVCGGLMSYLRYVCFCEYSGVQRIMCVFVSTVVSNALCVFLRVQWCPTHYVCFCEYSGVQRIMCVFVSTVVSNTLCVLL